MEEERRTCVKHDKIDTIERNILKLEGVMTSLSDAMTLIARKEVTVEQHSVKIDSIHKRLANLETGHTDMKDGIHDHCDLKTREINAGDEKIYNKMDEEVKVVNSNINTRFVWSLVVVAFSFGYLVLDNNSNNIKMDKILEITTSNKQALAVSKMEIAHIKKELDREIDHGHKGDE